MPPSTSSPNPAKHEHNARVTIGVLSKHTGVNIETIRYYERIQRRAAQVV
ncbi:MAG: MerR family DNA-binding transcriptional regulator [Hyphomicrobiaceae bacterium]